MKLTQEAYEIRAVQIQWEFDQKREKIMAQAHKDIDKAWKTYKDKIARLRND